MNFEQVLENISNLYMTGQIEQDHLPKILADMASNNEANIYQLIQYLNQLADENRTDGSNTFLGYAFMAYFLSLNYNHIYGNYNLARVSHTLGVILKIKGRYQESKQYLEQSCKLFEQLGEYECQSISLGDFGSACFFIGEYEKSVEALTEAYNRSLNYESIENTIEWSRGLGYAFNSIGEYDEALRYASIALDLSMHNNYGTNEIMTIFANVYENLGYLEKSLDLSMNLLIESIEEENVANMMCDLFNVARLNKSLNRHDEAIKKYKECQKLSLEYGHTSFYINSGIGLASYTDKKSAAAIFEELLSLSNTKGLEDISNDLLGNLGHLYIEDDPKKAIDFIQQSISKSKERNDNAGLIQDYLFLVDAYWKANDYSNAYDLTSQLVEQLEKIKDPVLNWKLLEKHYLNLVLFNAKPDLALSYLNKSISYLDSFIDSIRSDTNKLEFYSDKHQTYRRVVEHHLQYGNWQSAFVQHEKNKSKILRHSLKFNNVKHSDVDRENITDLVPLNCCYISYFLSNEVLYIFQVTKNDEISVYKKNISINEINIWKVKWNNIITSQKKDDIFSHNEMLQWLYLNFCKEPIEYCAENNITNIIFSPDSHLLNFPFHASVLDNGQYLIEHYCVSYLPSILNSSSALFGTDKKCLLISHSGKGKIKLKYPNSEVSEISKLIDSTCILESETTIESIKNHLSSHNIIHISSHSNYIDYSPENSHYELSEFLTAKKIASFDLQNVDLVFSASCQSLRSETNGLLEYSGLLRGWLLGGAKNIIGTFWNIDDFFAYQFSVNYYSKLKHYSLIDCYHKTLLDIIKDGRYASPYYWAGIAYFGNSITDK